MRKNTLLLMSALCVLTVSCQKSDDNENSKEAEQQRYVTFTPSLQAPTRATTTAFEQGDEIGVFAVKRGATLLEAGNYADNERYIYKETLFEPVGNGIEADADGLAFYAVYPYSANASNNMTFDVKTNQTTATAITQSDLCTAYCSTTTLKKVDMRFSHRLSRVIVKLQGVNLESKKISVTLKGVKTQTAVDLSKGSFEATGDASDVQMGLTGTNTYEALIAPQQIEAGLEFISVTVDNREVKFSQTSPLTLGSGRQAEYTIDVDNVVVIAGDINDWNQEGPITQLGDVTCTNSEALKFWVTSCERVGGVVIMDFMMKNVSGKNLTDLELWTGNYSMDNIFQSEAEDDLGKKYPHQLTFGNGLFEEDHFKIAQLTSGETVEGHVRITRPSAEGAFDPTNKAKNMSVWYQIQASNYDFSNSANSDKVGVVKFGRVPLTDNRLTTNGIQTCDRQLKFEVNSVQRGTNDWDGSVINIEYTITNLSAEPVLGFFLHGPGSYTSCYDQAGHGLNWRLAVGGSSFEGDMLTDIPANGSVKATVQVDDFEKTATTIYCLMECQAKNRQLDDGYLRFLAIPVGK